jgi:uncharacterized protein DUF1302
MKQMLFGGKPKKRVGKSARRWFQPMALMMILAVLICCHDQGFAMKLGQKGEGLYGNLDLTVSYGAMFRVENMRSNAHPVIDRNTDEGNRNFDAGLLFKALAELELRREFNNWNIGFFGRGYALYDAEIADVSNDHDMPIFNNNSGQLYNGSLNKNDEFTDKAENIAGRDIDFLDAVLFGDFFTDTSHTISAKLGYHALNWGESFFIPHGISSAMNPADISKASLPGTEFKEIMLPTNQVSASMNLLEGVSLSAYYQFDWKRAILPPVGTYFSPSDFVGDGAENLIIPAAGTNQAYVTVDRIGDDEPGEDGQWGASLGYYSEELFETEFNFFYINYHMKLPALGFVSRGGDVEASLLDPTSFVGFPSMAIDAGGYFHHYFEDVQLIGLSLNTSIIPIETAVGFEIAYHQDRPISTIDLPTAVGMMAMSPAGTVVEQATREDVIAAELTFLKDFNLPAIADDMAMVVDIGAVYTPDLDDGEFYNTIHIGDQFAWGYRVNLGATWYNAGGKMWDKLTGTDLIAGINWSHDVDGVSPLTFVEDTMSYGLSMEASWMNRISFKVGYNNFFGSNNGNRDRDNVTFSAKFFY